MKVDPKAALDHGLRGKTALVTGASSGLGERFAEVLAAAGASVALAARRRDNLNQIAERIEISGGKSYPITLDVSDIESHAAALDEIEAKLGPVDILVNNAGINVEGFVADFTVDQFDSMMDVNVRAAFFMAQQVGKRMIARGAAGRIINIASVGATHVLAGSAVYCITKAALGMMTRATAREWARYGINVNALCPGFIHTAINENWFKSEAGQKHLKSFPRRKLADVESLDGALLLLAGDQGRFITGSLYTVDDGQYI